MASSSHLRDIRQRSMKDVEIMASYDLLEAIKITITDFQESQRALADDVVRILRVKQGLLLADPSNATETLAERGVDYEGTKVEMESTLESLRDSINDDTGKISRAVVQFLNAEKQGQPPANETNTTVDFVQDSFSELLAGLAPSPRSANSAPSHQLDVPTSTNSGAVPGNAARPSTLRPPTNHWAAQSSSHDERKRHVTGIQRNPDVVPPSHQPEEEPSDESDDTLDHSYSHLSSADIDFTFLDAHPYEAHLELQKSLENKENLHFKLRAPGSHSPVNHNSMALDLSSKKRRHGEDTYTDPEASSLHSRKKRYHRNVRALVTNKSPEESTEVSLDDADDTSEPEVSIGDENQHPFPTSNDPIYQAYEALGIAKHHLFTHEDVAEKYTQLSEKHSHSSSAVKRYTAALDVIANSRKSLYLLTKKFKKVASPDIAYKPKSWLESLSSADDGAPSSPRATGDRSKLRNTTFLTNRWEKEHQPVGIKMVGFSHRRENTFAPGTVDDLGRSAAAKNYRAHLYAEDPAVTENRFQDEHDDEERYCFDHDIQTAAHHYHHQPDHHINHSAPAIENSVLYQSNFASGYAGRAVYSNPELGHDNADTGYPGTAANGINSPMHMMVPDAQHPQTCTGRAAPEYGVRGSPIPALGSPVPVLASLGSPILGTLPTSSILGTLGDSTYSLSQATIPEPHYRNAGSHPADHASSLGPPVYVDPREQRSRFATSTSSDVGAGADDGYFLAHRSFCS